jgi:hypothetical protein
MTVQRGYLVDAGYWQPLPPAGAKKQRGDNQWVRNPARNLLETNLVQDISLEA